jgi:hypothetical protein
MKYGFGFLSAVPLRKTASDRSQMVSQLIFGEVVEVLDVIAENWVLVKNAYDGYEGYLDPKQLLSIDQENFYRLSEIHFTNPKVGMLNTSKGNYLIPAASNLPDKEFIINDIHFRYEDELREISKIEKNLISEVARSYLNTPYLWGGKTSFGLDCSGFVQSVFKICGIKVLRDTAEQAKQGEIVDFIEEVESGDLAFFDDEMTNINHVGIVLNSDTIIHASGKVRTDKIDHQGIYNSEMGKYTHNLRVIKRY